MECGRVHRFAEKMKRILMALLFSYATLDPCFGQTGRSITGIDLTALLRNTAEIYIGYGFHQHWSVTCDASISIRESEDDMTQLEDEHHEELGIFKNTSHSGPDHHSASMFFSYWPKQVHDGFYLSLGIRSGTSRHITGIAQLGYMLTLWKGLGISTSVRVPFTEKVTDFFTTDNLNIGIQYKF